jgi:WYL domain
MSIILISTDSQSTTLTASDTSRHHTAQRVVLLWQLLCQQPYTLAQLQQCCLARDGQPLSLHTLKLYLSTLRAFDCPVERLKLPDGQTAYTIRQHGYLQPLLSGITPAQLDRLAEAGAMSASFIQQHQWLEWLGDLARWGHINWQVQLLPLDTARLIQQAISRQNMLRVHYRTLSDGHTRLMTCLPLGGYVRRHRHYLRVLHIKQDNPALLRIGRMSLVERLIPPDASLHHTLKMMTRYQPLVEVHFKTLFERDLPMLPDFRRLEVLPGGQGIKVFLETRDTFLLLQQLLGCGLPFEICQPDNLRLMVSQLFEQLTRQHGLHTMRDEPVSSPDVYSLEGLLNG